VIPFAQLISKKRKTVVAATATEDARPIALASRSGAIPHQALIRGPGHDQAWFDEGNRGSQAPSFLWFIKQQPDDIPRSKYPLAAKICSLGSCKGERPVFRAESTPRFAVSLQVMAGAPI
jgi:hypothetical protein